MARARNIKPAFFSNELLVDLDFATRLLFIGLWTEADRDGRLEDRPRRIKMALFPEDNLDIDSMLSELDRAGFIKRYAVGDVRAIQIVNWSKHQNPHVKEQASTIPAMPEIEPCQVDTETSTVQAPDMHGTCPADSISLDSLSLDSLNTEIPPAPPAPASKVKPDPLQGFGAFWIKYPRKTAKQDAEKAWAKLKPDADLQSILITAVDRQAKSLDWTKDGGKFIPHPATWLNGKRWDDQLTAAPLSKHGDFEKRDYYDGLTQREDGSYAF